MRLRKISLDSDGTIIIGERLFEFGLVEQRNTEVAERAGVAWIKLDRPAASGTRLLDPASEAVHLSEISVVKRHVGLERRGATNMRDGFIEIARLMRDNAEHVRGLRIIRLRSGG